ncbi:MAG: TIM barrel protein [Candidatus Woesearchaeota archaeon]
MREKMSDNYYKDESTSEPIFGIRTIGTTKWVDQSNPSPTGAIQSAIRMGAGTIEICAPGTGRGNPQAPTFEQFDQNQREAIREIIRVNKGTVDVQTHASPNVTLSGLGRDGFTEEQRRRNIEEVQKAVDFAAEAVGGGSVVVHTGEFPRTIGSKRVGGYNREGQEYQFEGHDKEDQDAQYILVDSKTGQLIKGVKEDEEIRIPVYKKNEDGEKEILRDDEGKPVYDDVMVTDIVTRKKIEEKYRDKWEEKMSPEEKFEFLTEEEKKEAQIQLFEEKNGNIQFEKKTFGEFYDDHKEKLKKKGIVEEEKIMEETLKEFFKEQAYGQVQQTLGQARELESSYTVGLKQREKIIKALKFYKNLKKNLSEEEWELQKKTIGGANDLIPPETKDPIEFLQEQLDDNRRRILYGRETASGGRKQAFELIQRINHAETVEKYGLEKNKKSVVELARYAREKTKSAREKRPNDDIKPIQINLENIYPTMQGQDYGSHPQELKTLVTQARDAFAQELMEKNGVSKAQAEKEAQDHIGATLDTGHLNMWKKHFKKKDGENEDEWTKRYNKWFTEQVEDLAKDNIIGNVHLADNFGYDDAHLAPGQGNAPVKEVMKILKKHGYSGKIQAEGGFAAGHNAGIFEAWKMAGTSTYAQGTNAWLNPSSQFSQIENYSMGAGNKPNFIFQGYAPDSDDWKPWSGTRLE